LEEKPLGLEAIEEARDRPDDSFGRTVESVFELRKQALQTQEEALRPRECGLGYKPAVAFPMSKRGEGITLAIVGAEVCATLDEVKQHDLFLQPTVLDSEPVDSKCADREVGDHRRPSWTSATDLVPILPDGGHDVIRVTANVLGDTGRVWLVLLTPVQEGLQEIHVTPETATLGGTIMEPILCGCAGGVAGRFTKVPRRLMSGGCAKSNTGRQLVQLLRDRSVLSDAGVFLCLGGSVEVESLVAAALRVVCLRVRTTEAIWPERVDTPDIMTARKYKYKLPNKENHGGRPTIIITTHCGSATR